MPQSDAAHSATLPLGRISLRPFEARDVEPCGRICYEAFRNVADRHGFPHDVPNAEVAAGMLSFLLETRGFYGVVAERDGVVAGSNWMDERSAVAGVGPVTVDPVIRDAGIGRRLMEDVIARSELQGSAGMRLVQVAYNVRSLSLYTKLGFASREELIVLSGVPENPQLRGYTVRPMQPDDLEPCNRLCQSVYGFPRTGELLTALSGPHAFVAVRGGAIRAYTSGLGYFGHTVGGTVESICALLAFAPHMPSVGVIVPVGNYPVFRWCLDHGMRAVVTMTLMSRGAYHAPNGPYLPSIVY